MTAVGTWVGGMGAIAAVLIGVQALRHDQDIRDEGRRNTEAARSEAQQAALADAARVQLHVSTMGWDGNDHLVGLSLVVVNETADVPAYKVRVECTHESYRRSFGQHTLSPGQWLRAPLLEAGEKDEVRALNVHRDDADELISDVRAATLVLFELHGQRWMLEGSQSLPQRTGGENHVIH